MDLCESEFHQKGETLIKGLHLPSKIVYEARINPFKVFTKSVEKATAVDRIVETNRCEQHGSEEVCQGEVTNCLRYLEGNLLL